MKHRAAGTLAGMLLGAWLAGAASAQTVTWTSDNGRVTFSYPAAWTGQINPTSGAFEIRPPGSAPGRSPAAMCTVFERTAVDDIDGTGPEAIDRLLMPLAQSFKLEPSELIENGKRVLGRTTAPNGDELTLALSLWRGSPDATILSMSCIRRANANAMETSPIRDILLSGRLVSPAP